MGTYQYKNHDKTTKLFMNVYVAELELPEDFEFKIDSSKLKSIQSWTFE